MMKINKRKYNKTYKNNLQIYNSKFKINKMLRIIHRKLNINLFKI